MKKHNPFILETERLQLREMTRADFPLLSSMLQDIEVMYAWERAFSDQEVYDWIDRRLAAYAESGYSYWLAADKKSGKIVGQIGLLNEDIDGVAHLGIGWILCREHWGKGYAVEGAAGCFDYAFNTLHAPGVIADIRPMNVASIRVAEKLGMIASGQYDKIVNGTIMPHRLYYMRNPQVIVTDYDPAWLRQFEELKLFLEPVLKKFGGNLEHVGSTAVPGLAAKPRIDADYILSPAVTFGDVKDTLAEMGFIHRGDGGLPGREMFTENLHLSFAHNFYVCNPDSPHLANHLKLRDYLRSHPEATHRYGALKKQLATQFPNDVDSYCAGKSDLLSEFLAAIGFTDSIVAEINRINRFSVTSDDNH